MKTAQEIYNQFDTFFNSLCHEDSIDILLSLQASNNPNLTVKVNNEVMYDSVLSSGDHKIQLSCGVKEVMILDISMHGKTARDTVVQNNQIVQDKFIKITGLEINKFDLFNDQELFYSKFTYLNDQNMSIPTKAGFWNNSTLKLEFTTPFAQWHTLNSHKNSYFSDSLQYRNNSQTDEVFVDLTKNIQLLR